MRTGGAGPSGRWQWLYRESKVERRNASKGLDATCIFLGCRWGFIRNLKGVQLDFVIARRGARVVGGRRGAGLHARRRGEWLGVRRGGHRGVGVGGAHSLEGPVLRPAHKAALSAASIRRTPAALAVQLRHYGGAADRGRQLVDAERQFDLAAPHCQCSRALPAMATPGSPLSTGLPYEYIFKYIIIGARLAPRNRHVSR